MTQNFLQLKEKKKTRLLSSKFLLKFPVQIWLVDSQLYVLRQRDDVNHLDEFLGSLLVFFILIFKSVHAIQTWITQHHIILNLPLLQSLS